MIARIWNAMLAAADLRIWLLVGSGPILTGTALWLTSQVIGGKVEGQALTLLGWAMIANWLLLAVVVASLAMVKLSVTAGGVTGTIESGK